MMFNTRHEHETNTVKHNRLAMPAVNTHDLSQIEFFPKLLNSTSITHRTIDPKKKKKSHPTIRKCCFFICKKIVTVSV